MPPLSAVRRPYRGRNGEWWPKCGPVRERIGDETVIFAHGIPDSRPVGGRREAGPWVAAEFFVIVEPNLGAVGDK